MKVHMKVMREARRRCLVSSMSHDSAYRIQAKSITCSSTSNLLVLVQVKRLASYYIVEGHRETNANQATTRHHPGPSEL
jgi:hypothetical protein